MQEHVKVKKKTWLDNPVPTQGLNCGCKLQEVLHMKHVCALLTENCSNPDLGSSGYITCELTEKQLTTTEDKE